MSFSDFKDSIVFDSWDCGAVERRVRVRRGVSTNPGCSVLLQTCQLSRWEENEQRENKSASWYSTVPWG